MWIARVIASFFDTAPAGAEYECECLWCDHETASRSYGVAWVTMSVHLGFASDHPDPEEVPENWNAHVETHLRPTVTTGRGGA